MDGYEERYCAYVDILGFRNLVESAGRKKRQFEVIRDLLKKIHQPAQLRFIKLIDVDFRAQSISDAVALSTKKSEAGISVLTTTLANLVCDLLKEGYFTRGAMCKGLLFHDEGVVFGPALIKAFTLESTTVRFPRIMVTSDVVADGVKGSILTDFKEHVRQADDGPYYVHVLWQLEAILKNKVPDMEWEKAHYEKFQQIGKRLQHRFKESVDTPNHFEKVRWFSRYWNDTVVPNNFGIARVTGAGL